MIVLALSVLFTLIKVVYLIRVFRQLNFLVTMFITVVKEIYYFMILFLIFALTFAEMYHLMQVDVTPYGRTPKLFSYIITVIRCAMGDFSLIDMKEGFDLIQNPDAEGDDRYEHSFVIVLFTFAFFLICCFYMFMIFMNFMIAVIGESYSKVILNKEAFDYQQRAAMIYERESHFSAEELDNALYFPRIIIVRRVKEAEPKLKNNWKSYISIVKDHIKLNSAKCIEAVGKKSAAIIQ